MKQIWLRRGAACICLALAALSAYKLISYVRQSVQAEQDFTLLAKQVHIEQSLEQPASEPDMPWTPPMELTTLSEENEDFFGWVSIADTRIDYPVLYTPEKPEYYLYRDFSKKYSISGTPFLDGRCAPDSDQLILWGHNMRSGTMFANLLRYQKQEYWQSHPTVSFTTLTWSRTYRVLAAFDSAVNDKKNPFHWYDQLTFADEAAFEKFVDQLAEYSVFPLPEQPEYGGDFLTLATCSQRNHGRFVVVAYCAP